MDRATKVELARLRDEDNRQNQRLRALEKSMSLMKELTISVHTLAHDMKQMLDEQKEQGKRLDKLEAAPAEQWGSMKRTVFNTVIGAGAGAFATGAIYMMAQFIK
ncbi:MAG: hypothetical protein ACLT46_17135 [Hungatella sp.]